MGIAPIDGGPQLDFDESSTVTEDELVLGVSTALFGCPEVGSTMPTLTSVPTLAPRHTPVAADGVTNVVANETVIVANKLRGASSLVSSAAAAVRHGSAAALETAERIDIAEARCPLGSATVITGTFPANLRATLNNCTVVTEDGTISLPGTFHQLATSFSVNVSVRLRVTNETIAILGYALLLVSLGRCKTQAALLMIREGRRRTTVPPRPATGMTFTGTRRGLSGLGYNSFADCLLVAYNDRLNGPGALLTTTGETVPSTFDPLEARVTRSGGFVIHSRGGHADVPPRSERGSVASGSIFPSGGLEVMPSSGQVASGDDTSVAIDNDGDGPPPR